MGFLACLLLLSSVVLGLLYWMTHEELHQRTEEIAQVRRQFDRYLNDDQRAFDLLWNRAQMEVARAIRTRRTP